MGGSRAVRGSLAVRLDSGAPLRYTPSPYPNWRGCCVLGCGQFIRANKRMRLYGKMKYLFQHSWHGSNFRARYDLDLYTMNINGTNVKQITNTLGYDGGAFFSPDGKKIVFRASRFKTEEEKEEYKTLLKQGLVAPTNMEIFVCNVDGSGLKQITNLGKANWAPFYHPPTGADVVCWDVGSSSVPINECVCMVK
ncbi:MAG: hypothetical protein LW821_01870 [Flammeovirgaceae bacterium]|jgi:hypothetical protein|nr:hypothetical protein [Flammeovirgaceae bacterium]